MPPEHCATPLLNALQVPLVVVGIDRRLEGDPVFLILRLRSSPAPPRHSLHPLLLELRHGGSRPARKCR